mgnify:CR=1 FL=1
MRTARTPTPILMLALLAASGPALAQYDARYEEAGYGYEAIPENVSYGYAQVLRAEEVYETVVTRTPEERCDDVEYRQSGRTTGGTVIGAIVGAALGNQVGDGGTVSTGVGAVAEVGRLSLRGFKPGQLSEQGQLRVQELRLTDLVQLMLPPEAAQLLAESPLWLDYRYQYLPEQDFLVLQQQLHWPASIAEPGEQIAL